MFNAERAEEFDTLKLHVIVPSELNKEGLARLFSSYNVEIYRSPLPKNFAIVGPFTSTEEAKRAILEFDNQPPFNMKVRFAKNMKKRKNNNESYEKNLSYDRQSDTRAMSVASDSHSLEKVQSQNRFHGPNNAKAKQPYNSRSSNGPVDTSVTSPVDAEILYERSYMLLARENFAEFKGESWFKTFLKDMVYTYMSNVKNPTHDFQELYKAFEASKEAITYNGSGDQASGHSQNAVNKRLFIAETCKVGTKTLLTINSSGSEGNICSIMIEDSEQYQSLLDSFSEICEKLPTVANTDSIVTESRGMMAVKLAADNNWYRTVALGQTWALVDVGQVVSPLQVLKTVVCPKPHANYPFYSCLLTHSITNIKDWEKSFQVEVLSASDRTIEVNLSNPEYGRSFLGQLNPWVASITAAGPVNSMPKAPSIRKFVAENCSVNEKLSMSVISKTDEGLLCITNNKDTAHQYSSLMEEFNQICDKQQPPLEQAGSGDLMAVKLKKSRDEKEGWFRAVSHEQGWALADEGFVVTPLDVQKTMTCPSSHANIPFFSCLLKHDLKHFEGFPTNYTIKILKKDVATRRLDLEVFNDKEGYKFNGYLQPWIPAVGGRQPICGPLDPFAKGCRVRTPVRDVPAVARVPAPATVGRVPAPAAVARVPASVTVPRVSIPATVARVRSPAAVARVPAPATVARVRSPAAVARFPAPATVARFPAPATVARVSTPATVTRAPIQAAVARVSVPAITPVLTAPTKASPLPIATASPSIVPKERPATAVCNTKMLADVLNVGEPMDVIVQSKDGDGFRCIIMHADYLQKYELLCSDEFGSDCEKQPLAIPRSGALMAVKIADKDDAWFRAKWQNSLWILMDDGNTSSRDQVKRIVDCPQAYVDIPFLSCHLTPDMKSKTQHSSNYVATITRKEEAKQLVFARVKGENVEFTGRMQPLTYAPELQEILPENKATANGPHTLVPVKNKKNDPASEVMLASKAAVTLKIMRCMAETCNVKDEITLFVVSAESPGVLLCLHAGPTPDNLFESLIEEFKTACEREIPLPTASDHQGLVAVELANTEMDGWYRAVPLHQKWALPDDGRAVAKTDVKRIVRCPPSFEDIPFFCYLLKHNNPKPVDSCKATIISKNEATRTLEVTVCPDGTQDKYSGKLQPWIPTIELCQQRPEGNAASPEVSTPKTPKLIYGERYCSAETCEIGEEMRFTLLSGKCSVTWQVCLAVSSRNEHQHRLMQKEFVGACEQACQEVGAGAEVELQGGHRGLMAVMVWRDAMWHRALATPREGWALVDSGTIVPYKSVKHCLPCPEAFADIPFLCCQIFGPIAVDFNAIYSFRVTSKHVPNRTLSVEIRNDENQQKCKGTIKPWVPFALCHSTISHRLSTVGLTSERLDNSNVQPVFYKDLSKLTVSVGTRLLLVKFIDFANVFIQLADSENKSEFVEHREKIAEYGFQSQSLSCFPLEGQVVLAPAYDMYNRVMVNNVDGDKCSVFYLDTGDKKFVDLCELRMSPRWVGQVPPLLCVSLAQLSTLRPNSPCISAIEKFISNKTVFKCKEITNSGMHLMVEQSMTDLNKMLVDLCTPTWKKLHDQGQGLYNLPVANYEEIQYVPLRANQKVRILDSTMIIIGAVSCMPDLPLWDVKLDDLTKEFEGYCSIMTDPYLPRQFEVCLYKNAAGKWYRAYVVEVQGDVLNLHSIDDGKMINNINFTNIRKMPLEYLDYLPALASLCTLQDFPSDPSEKLVKRANEIINANGVFTITTLKKNSEGSYDISIKSLTDALRLEGLL